MRTGFCIVSLVALTAARAVAATFTVTTTVDAVDAAPGDGVCETAPGNHVCTLRAAVQEANALAGDDTIVLPAGTYALTLVGPGEDAAATGDLDVLDTLTVTGAGADTTIVDGQGSDRLFDVLSPASATLQGVTLQHGAASQGAAIEGMGGAVTLEGCSVLDNDGGFTVYALNGLTVDGSTFRSNSGTALFSGASLSASNCVVSDNGGDGARSSYGADVTSCVFSSNGGFGFSVGAGSTVADCTIVDNAQGGVGLANYPTPLANTLTRSVVSRNRGIGVLAAVDVATDISDCTISDNDDSPTGIGGIAAYGPTTVKNSRISGNVGVGVLSNQEGAVYSLMLSGVTVDGSGGPGVETFGDHAIIDQTTISGNHGAGLVVGNSTTLTNSTVVGNGAVGVVVQSFGIGLFPYALQMDNTILAGNAPSDCTGTIDDSLGHNLVQVPTGCTIGGTLTGDLVGVDPLLGPLADNGGLTPTHALLPGSPAVDAGADCGTVDQRGVPRPHGAACDIGAYERTCGDGVLDPGEQCDDGAASGAPGTCCTSTCRFAVQGAACTADGSPCTADVCDAAGSCTHAVPVDAGCMVAESAKATLVLKRGSTTKTDSLTWKWTSSDDVAPAALGNPLDTTQYTVCVIGGAASAADVVLAATAPAGGTCHGKQCWTPSAKGYRYRDPDLAPDGLSTMALRSGPAGRATVTAAGHGPLLGLPDVALATPTVVRVVRNDASACWQATFSHPSRNDARQFKAKSD